MEEWIERRARSPRVRQFVAMLARVSTFTADHVAVERPCGARSIPPRHDHGVLYLDGGWQTLVAGLEQRARGLGVEIRLGETVESLKAMPGRWHRPRRAPGCGRADYRPQSAGDVSGARWPVSTWACASCLRVRHGSLSASISRSISLVHSAVASLAPAGAALVHVAKYLAGQTDAASDRRELEQFVDLAIPGWREQVELVRFLPQHDRHRRGLFAAGPARRG